MDVKSIEDAKHILLITNNKSFANATALYTYLLTLHKKVTLYSEESIAFKLSFLPWYEKIKYSSPLSADFVLQVECETLKYTSFFQKNEIKINKKMATSLYAGLLVEYENFTSSHVCGMVFATASELISLGAQHLTARKQITKSNSLAFFRLKSRLYMSMTLRDNAKIAELYISDEDLSATGALLEDAYKIMYEFLNLVHVESVILKKKDEDMKVIKIVEEMAFEK